MKRRHVWPEGHWAWPIQVSHKHGLRSGQMIWIGGQRGLGEAYRIGLGP